MIPVSCNEKIAQHRHLIQLTTEGFNEIVRRMEKCNVDRDSARHTGLFF